MLYYYIFINLFTFLLFGLDKKAAINKRWRIKESLLLALNIIGGFIGGFLGMNFFRHKTKKIKFQIILFFSLILHVLLIIIFNKPNIY